MLFKNLVQVSRFGHRMNASTSRVRDRRARRPLVEALEGRALLATIQFLNGGASFRDNLDTPADTTHSSQSTSIVIHSLSDSQTQSLGSPLNSGSLAIIGVNTSTDFVSPFRHTFRIFYGNYSANSTNPKPSLAIAALNGGTATIMAGTGEAIGTPVYVKVAAYFTDEDGIESSNGTVHRSDGSYSGSFGVSGGSQGQSFSFTAKLGPNDQTTSDSKILLFHVGDTINIAFSGTGSSPGTTADLATEFAADINVVPPPASPDIAVTLASTTDAKSVNLNYTVSGADLSQSFQVAVYRSPTPNFNINTAIPMGIQATIPATDNNGASSTAQGTHTVTVNLGGEIQPDSNHAQTHPYVFVVANPPGNGHIPESDDSNDTNDVASLGALTVDQLRSIMPGTSRITVSFMVDDATRYIDPLNAAMGEWAIITPKRQAAFLAQMAEESSQLSSWFEKSNFNAVTPNDPKNIKHLRSDRDGYGASSPQDYFNYWYSDVNGNGDEASGDGYRFRGRGPIQITGRAIYQQVANALGMPALTSNTAAGDALRDQIADSNNLLLGFRVAAAYFQLNGLNHVADQVDSHNLSSIISTNIAVTQGVNGNGLRGLQTRLRYYISVLAVFDASVAFLINPNIG